MLIYFPFLPLAWNTLLSDDADSLICQENANDTSKYLPSLPQMFEAHIEVTDQQRNLTFSIVEHSDAEQTSVTRFFGGTTTKCTYNNNDKKGFVVSGIQCNWTENFPQDCFCSISSCVPFVPLSTVFAYLTQHGASYTGATVCREIQSEGWTLNCSNQNNTANTFSIQIAFNQLNHEMPNGENDVPLKIILQDHGQFFFSNQPLLQLVYEITLFRNGHVQNNEVFLPPPGVFCRYPVLHPMPTLANLFSVTMETVLNDKQVISYIQHHYDALQKLVSFTVRSHQHGRVSLGSTFQMPHSGDRYRVVHDFESGVQYMIDERNMNCTVSAIPSTSFDVVLEDDLHIRLRHANELLNGVTDQYVYIGERITRGIPCQVYVTEKPINIRGEYSTVEVYFTQATWNVQVEIVNEEKLAPMGISTYVAKSPTARNFSNVIHTYFFGYAIGHPDWKNFDVTQCLSSTNRLFLLFTLKTSYSKLVEKGLELVQDSLKRTIAELAGISPLRVTNIFLSIARLPDEAKVWFVLLDQPNIKADSLNKKTTISLAKAHSILKDFIMEGDTPVTLDISSSKLEVVIKKSSLETTTENLHPNSRFQSLTLKSGYTAGSMTGLGFSMVILGTCIGILIGFMLWKKGSGVPYIVHD